MAVQKILVVDDEARMRKLVSDFLVREGYEVLEAANGEEAMDLFYADKEIVLIILDVMMPKMDGWQALREIRESSQVPVIMLTARADERDELKGFDLGVDEYVTKPFSPRELVSRVKAVLRRSEGSAGAAGASAGAGADRDAASDRGRHGPRHDVAQRDGQEDGHPGGYRLD